MGGPGDITEGRRNHAWGRHVRSTGSIGNRSHKRKTCRKIRLPIDREATTHTHTPGQVINFVRLPLENRYVFTTHTTFYLRPPPPEMCQFFLDTSLGRGKPG